MWSSRYWTARHWLARYWSATGKTVVPYAPPIRFDPASRTRFRCQGRTTLSERGPRLRFRPRART